MISCPLCDFANIEGVDVCEQCGQPLDETHLPDPKTAVERGLITDPVSSLSPCTPIVVSPETPVRDVLTLMIQHRIGCVLIVEQGQPVGIFSERDALVRLNTRAHELADRAIAEFMTPSPQMLKEDARLVFAVHQMDVGGYRHLPILHRDGELRGVISVRDLLRYLTEKITASGCPSA
jgi:CBS domain-containing protein